MESVSSELAHCTVKDLQDRPYHFGSLYAERTTLVVFVRHFGCVFCRERVGEISRLYPQILEAGAHAVIIGMGTPLMAEDFAQQFEITAPLYVDSTGDAYTHAGFRRNFGLTLRTVSRAWSTYRNGIRQGKPQGDVWQQGGLLVITPDGSILNHQVDSEAATTIDWKVAMSVLTTNITRPPHSAHEVA